MRHFGWLVFALSLLAPAPAVAQTRDQATCFAGIDRNVLGACSRFIEDTNRKIDQVASTKTPVKDKERNLYLLRNLRGGAHQAMARRHAADGDTLKSTEFHQRAIEDFDEAVRLDPKQLHALLNRGNSLAEISLLDRAIHDFEQVLQIDPKNAFAFNNRGGAYGEKGDFAGAIADLERAIALKPKYTDALVNRGSIYQQKKDYVRAIADLDAAVLNGARDVYVLSARGRAWRDGGDDSRAKADFEAVLSTTAVDKRSKAVQEATRELLRALQEKTEREQAAKREKAELDRIERERVALENAELQKAERERVERELAEKAARDRAEKAAKERAALERAAREKAERERAAREKIERDKAARERAELEKAAREQAAREKVELEKAEREKVALQKAEQVAREKADRIARQQAAREKAARDREERERAEREKIRAKRVALTIGNSAYRPLNRLANPRNDAAAIAKAFDALDFTVFHGVDLDRSQTTDIVDRFAHAAREAEVAIFFFAGHGLQYDEINYLAPVDADGRDLGSFIKLQSIMERLQSRQGVRILIIDACRTRPETQLTDKPSSPTGRSITLVRGFAPVEHRTIPRGMFLAFAAAPGETADDGVRVNSPFTGALLRHLLTPGLELRRLFTLVRQEVVADTKDQQRPVSVDDLLHEEIVLKGARK
jgi:Tfp pilus assembly protein PilF